MNENNSDPNEGEKLEFSSGLICEFLEVAIHQILHSRSVYPKQVFVRKKKYHVPVYMSCNTEVNSYITSVLLSMKDFIKEKCIRQIIVNIKQQRKIVEKFVFELNHLNVICGLDDELLINLEQSLRGILLKLTTCTTVLKAISDEEKESRTFEVLILMQSFSAIDFLNKNNPKLTWSKAQLDISDASQEKIIPLKSITDSPLVQMQVFYVKSPKQVL